MITDEQILVLLKVYYPRTYAPCQEEIKLMRKALEAYEANKPKPEPVGYGLVIKGVLHATKDEAGSVGFVPLYTTPPTREPLTPQEVSKILFECSKGTTMFWNFAKAVEQAHGIGVNNA